MCLILFWGCAARVIMICQCRLIDFNKRPALCGILTVQTAPHAKVRDYMMNLFAQFHYKPETIPKVKLMKQTAYKNSQ